ncbi:MAG: L,D-transpeptidase [Hyphomicrobiales bacterium]
MFGKWFSRSALAGIGIIIAGSLLSAPAAQAGSRYAEAPPVVLSPDLTEPWQLQLTTPKRAKVVTRSTRSYTPTKKKRKAAKKRSLKRKLALSSGAQSQRRATQQRRQSLAPRFLPQQVEYNTKHKLGTIIIDTKSRYLYLVQANGEARRYGVGVGKQGFGWTGTERVTRKAKWPSWTPPKSMIARERAKGRILPNFMPGGPENPMGARGIYLGSTLYRIHGTNAPWTIGQAVSSGCFRMRNQDVQDLYDRVRVGAKVVVI